MLGVRNQRFIHPGCRLKQLRQIYRFNSSWNGRFDCISLYLAINPHQVLDLMLAANSNCSRHSNSIIFSNMHRNNHNRCRSIDFCIAWINEHAEPAAIIPFDAPGSDFYRFVSYGSRNRQVSQSSENLSFGLLKPDWVGRTECHNVRARSETWGWRGYLYGKRLGTCVALSKRYAVWLNYPSQTYKKRKQQIQALLYGLESTQGDFRWAQRFEQSCHEEIPMFLADETNLYLFASILSQRFSHDQSSLAATVPSGIECEELLRVSPS